MQGWSHKRTCRVCGASDLVKVLDLGATPPANAYLTREELDKPEAVFPLALYFCRTCTLAQLLDVVDPKILFSNYHYVTGASPPLIRHFREYAETAVRPFLSSRDDLVIDIGGNDGLLLSFIKDYARVLNVDPADNLAPLSERRGVPFYPAFFTSKVAESLVKTHGNAKVVVANNVFAHIDPIRDVFAGVAKLIGDGGVLVFQVHWAMHLVRESCFDQIYHEHLCFYSLHAAKYLVEASGMHIFDVEIVPSQGKSLRVYAAKSRAASSRVAEILEEERAGGLTTEGVYERFAANVRANKEKILALLSGLKAQGKKIVGYGAPAKGNTLLNYYGLGTETLDYLTDTTPVKQGLYSPGMHIPIVPPERLLVDTPDYILLLAWNFKDDIIEKEKHLRERGVKFLVTVPEVAIL